MELRKKIQLKMYATYYLGYYPLYGKSKYVYKSQEFFIALNIVAGFFFDKSWSLDQTQKICRDVWDDNLDLGTMEPPFNTTLYS